jgi:hypothetical protein
MSRRTSKKLSVLMAASCWRVLIARAAYPFYAKRTLRRTLVATAAAMHHHDKRRIRRRLAIRLPKSGVYLKSIDCLYREVS